MSYEKFSYPQLKHECAVRGLGGSGNREVLTQRLEADDARVIEPEPIPTPKTPPYSNYDEEGKWRRRPKGFISWAEEQRKAG